MFKILSLSIVKMHACLNDCMLFYKNTENVNACNYCQSSRYIHRDNKSLKKPAKVLRYLPIIPTLQKLF